MTDNEGTQPSPSVPQEELDRLARATLVGSDGDKIGNVEQVYVDDSTGKPSWVSVKTGLFGTHATLVPVDAATGSGDELKVPYTKDIVKGAPKIDADEHVSRSEETELHDYYRSHGWRGDEAGDEKDAAVTGTGTGTGTGSDSDRGADNGTAAADQRTDATAGSDGFNASDETRRGRHAAGDTSGLAAGGAAAGVGAAGVAGAAWASRGNDGGSADAANDGATNERPASPSEPTTTYGSEPSNQAAGFGDDRPVDPTTADAPTAPAVGTIPDPSGRADVPTTPSADPTLGAFDSPAPGTAGPDASTNAGADVFGDSALPQSDSADAGLMSTGGEIDQQPSGSDWEGDEANSYAFSARPTAGGGADAQSDGSAVDDWAAEGGSTDGVDRGSADGSADGSTGGATGGRRISGYDEVVDGGYSVGSAAPIHDNAQPLGHGVRAWQDTMSFRDGDETDGEREPDVWFLDSNAAQNAGFHPAD
ncbi:PRC-barrel domain-containing protein [Calidifontibacter terrae]